jgi:hypothetical protein
MKTPVLPMKQPDKKRMMSENSLKLHVQQLQDFDELFPAKTIRY